MVAALPIRLRVGPHAEDTFRSRTFAFGCTAAVAARLTGITRILVAENGQGSIGAALVPFGGEVPYRTTHPLFTARLTDFLTSIGLQIRFEHPYLWKTKGTVLRDLSARGLCNSWEVTRSCARNVRRTKQVPDERACGICGNCVLRRVAVHAAGLHENAGYHWDFVAPTLNAAQAAGAAKGTSTTDLDFASRSVIAMDEFARLPDDSPAARRNAFAISEKLGTPVADIAREQRTLRTAHALEWTSFLTNLPRDSWVHRFAETST